MHGLGHILRGTPTSLWYFIVELFNVVSDLSKGGEEEGKKRKETVVTSKTENNTNQGLGAIVASTSSQMIGSRSVL